MSEIKSAKLLFFEFRYKNKFQVIVFVGILILAIYLFSESFIRGDVISYVYSCNNEAVTIHKKYPFPIDIIKGDYTKIPWVDIKSINRIKKDSKDTYYVVGLNNGEKITFRNGDLFACKIVKIAQQIKVSLTGFSLWERNYNSICD